jgi:hypothetical protein
MMIKFRGSEAVHGVGFIFGKELPKFHPEQVRLLVVLSSLVEGGGDKSAAKSSHNCFIIIFLNV